MTRRRQTQKKRTHRVAGEDPQVLLPLLRRAADSGVPNDDGTYHLHAVYDDEVVLPLVRALMRVEAELLLDEARHLGVHGWSWRSPEARRLDAFGLLTLRVVAASTGRSVDALLAERGGHRRTHRGVA